MKTLTTKTLAALLILSIVACTFTTTPSAEANNCWLAVLACIAAAEDAYEKCKDAADNWQEALKCGLALSKALTVCWKAYDECKDLLSESSS